MHIELKCGQTVIKLRDFYYLNKASALTIADRPLPIAGFP